MEEIEMTDEWLQRQKQKQDPKQQFAMNLLPPDVRANKRIIKEGELEYALKWVSTDTEDETESKLCFQQLGIRDNSEGINQERVLLISDYIWSQHPAKPDFSSLLSWVKIRAVREQVKEMCKDKESEMSSDLKIFTKNGRWNEKQFLKLYRFIEKQSLENPSFYLLRLYANDFVTLQGEVKNKKNIPWKWLLPHTKQETPSANTETAFKIAQRAIEVFLDRSIEETISGKEIRTIEKMSLWFLNKATSKYLWYIETIVTASTVKRTKKWKMWAKQLFGGNLGGVCWDRLEAVCYFIRANLEKTPDYSLLVDWVNNEVNIHGVGKIRAEMEGNWKGKNYKDIFG